MHRRVFVPESPGVAFVAMIIGHAVQRLLQMSELPKRGAKANSKGHSSGLLMVEYLRHGKMQKKTEMLSFDAGIAAASITESRDHATCMVCFGE